MSTNNPSAATATIADVVVGMSTPSPLRRRRVDNAMIHGAALCPDGGVVAIRCDTSYEPEGVRRRWTVIVVPADVAGEPATSTRINNVSVMHGAWWRTRKEARREARRLTGVEIR